ncbi:uncharacterized protein si:dkey-86e18.1 isoform X2 [Cheilinus undulatus]|uniref:uncharacterized protein si:dkey-86e18.1 isoform X2 n=1 Tax=Cheilinus undulatus TaxID=241271 RepID=UPI001BD40D6A|nr:uncharacterized protein si:dkey-86e18.1 isoform X2 [Cheilinus undulatus]
MARNEEKQQGRLNRLWLQKEREEGRLRDAHEQRPRLSALTSASSVKKWIPSIKSEIEYYLQSQLTHYPERKIAEFQLHIESLEREYKSFITKLRILDPNCKHTPWTPRAYCKRRADPPDTPRALKSPRLCGSDGVHADRQSEEESGGNRPSDSARALMVYSEPSLETICKVQDQDQPLTFDPVRLSVCAAAFRGSRSQPASSHTHNLAQILQSRLPNLSNSSSSSSWRSRDSEKEGGSEKRGHVEEQDHTAQRNSGKSSVSESIERTVNILGLDCYSSSSEEEEEEEGK